MNSKCNILYYDDADAVKDVWFIRHSYKMIDLFIGTRKINNE